MIALYQELSELFQQTRNALDELSKLLEEEAQCLASRDMPVLELTASAKQRLAHRLNDLASRQHDFLETCGLLTDEGGIDTFLLQLDSALPQTQSLRIQWSEIVHMGSTCRKQNELNGAYLALLQRHIDSYLKFFYDTFSADATYQPDGSTHRGEISRRSFLA